MGLPPSPVSRYARAVTATEALDFTDDEILEAKRRTQGVYCAELDRLAHDVIRSSVACMKGDREARNRVFKHLVRAYLAIFVAGWIALVAAIVAGFMDHTATTAVFGGMSAASFLSLTLFRPLKALRENSIFLTWLNVTTTSYWTRHYYLNKKGLLDEEIEEATAETLAHLRALLADLPEGLPLEPEGILEHQ
jgi:hypothetical protein